MTTKRSKRAWEAHLDRDEAKRMKQIERELGQIETRLTLLRAERNRIQNRATTRAVRQ